MPASHLPNSVPRSGRYFLCFPTLLGLHPACSYSSYFFAVLSLLMVVLTAFPGTRSAGVPFWHVETTAAACIPIIQKVCMGLGRYYSIRRLRVRPLPTQGGCNTRWSGAWRCWRPLLVVVVCRRGWLEPHTSMASTAATAASSASATVSATTASPHCCSICLKYVGSLCSQCHCHSHSEDP